jgi:hypothetical protein
MLVLNNTPFNHRLNSDDRAADPRFTYIDYRLQDMTPDVNNGIRTMPYWLAFFLFN